MLLFFCNFVSFSQTTPIEIKFDLEKMETGHLGLSDFVESIEYIPLETKDECVIGQGMVFDYDDTHIVVKYNETKAVYLFDRKGGFIRTIGRRGNGPEEFEGIHTLYMDSEKNCIIIEANRKALYFDKQGEFLHSTSFPIDDRAANAYFRGLFLRTAESYVYNDSTYSVYTIYNQKGHLLKEAVSSIPIHLENKGNWRIIYKCKQIVPVYTYQNMPHVREYLNDTVYVINGLNQFKPKYIFNLGKYKVTREIQEDIEHFTERIQSKVVILDIIETSDKLLIQYFREWNIYSCYYDKKDGKLYKLADNGYPNDYDGGINFVTRASNGQKKSICSHCFLCRRIFVSLRKERKRRDKSQRPEICQSDI